MLNICQRHFGKLSFKALICGVILAIVPSLLFGEESIRIGILSSSQGSTEEYETRLKDTIIMLIEQRNREGGLLGRELQAVVADPGSSWPMYEEKLRQLITEQDVDVIFGASTSISRKSLLAAIEELNGIVFYPAKYEGEESSKNIFYFGSVPNQNAIPSVDFLMGQYGVEKWVLLGTDSVYSRTTNEVLKNYLGLKGFIDEDIMIDYMGFGESSWESIIKNVKQYSNGEEKVAIISSISGYSNEPFFRELRNHGVESADIPVISLLLDDHSLSLIDPSILEGHLVIGSYFMGIATDVNESFVDSWKRFKDDDGAITTEAMEAYYIAFNSWIKAVEKAKTTEPDIIQNVLIGMEVPNLTGSTAEILPNHHIAKPVFVGRIQKSGQIKVIWRSPSNIPGDAWSDYLPGSSQKIADWRSPLLCEEFSFVTGSCGDSGAISDPDAEDVDYAYQELAEAATELEPDTDVDSPDPYVVQLSAQERLLMPGPAGSMLVWIGQKGYEPDLSSGFVKDEESIEDSSRTAKIKPVAPDFEVKPEETACIRISPKGSSTRFTLKPKSAGDFPVSARVDLHETADCSDTPTPKSTVDLTVTVDVDGAASFQARISELLAVFWKSFLNFWEQLLFVAFGLSLYLARKKIKKVFGYEPKSH